MKILLVNDTSAHLNWGAQATPFALRQMLGRELPAAEVSILENEWLHRDYRAIRVPGRKPVLYRRGSIPRVQWVLDKLSEPVEHFPSVADDFEVFAQEWKQGAGGPPSREFTKQAMGVDAVIYNAENSIYRNTKEGQRGIFLAWYAKTALGRSAAVINQTAHITGVRPIMRGMIQRAYPDLDYVTAREPMSLRCLRELGIKSAELVPDPVFAIDPEPKPSSTFERWWNSSGLRNSEFFCFSTSGLPVSRPRGNWDGEVAHLVRKLQQNGARAVLVAKDPHSQFLREVARRTEALFFGPEHHFLDLWPLFRRAAFVVTGHYHYAIIAAIVGCPFVPLSTNNHKMSGLCELLGQPGVQPFDITYLGGCADGIIAAAAEVQRQREVLSAELKQRTSGLRVQAMESVTMLRDLLTDGIALSRQSTDGGTAAPGAQNVESKPYE